MNLHTSDYLQTLLWIADNPDADERPLEGATIQQFSQPFQDAVHGFIEGFRNYLHHADPEALEYADEAPERALGSNVYLSLSCAGAGFSDECDPMGNQLQNHLETYAGDRHRFEELDSQLDMEDDVIDLAFVPEAIDHYRTRRFLAPWIDKPTPGSFTATAPGHVPAEGPTPAAAVAAFYAANPFKH